MAMAMRLLIAATTTPNDIERYKARIMKIHSPRGPREDDVEVLVFDGSQMLQEYTAQGTRLYAASAVCEQLTVLQDIRYWTENFFLVNYARSSAGGKRLRDLPLFACRLEAPRPKSA